MSCANTCLHVVYMGHACLKGPTLNKWTDTIQMEYMVLTFTAHHLVAKRYFMMGITYSKAVWFGPIDNIHGLIPSTVDRGVSSSWMIALLGC